MLRASLPCIQNTSNCDLDGILVYPDNIKPLRVALQVDLQESARLVREVAVLCEGVDEVLVAVTGVVSIQPEVGPLHEDVGDELPSGPVQDVGGESLNQPR